MCNPIICQIDPANVKVADLIMIGENMESYYIAIIPDGFYKAIRNPIKTMCVLKQHIKSSKAKPVVDLENIFLRLLMIGQQQQVELGPLFAYE